MLLGYIRVSTVEQNEERQTRALLEKGVEKENLYIDKQSGKNADREQLKALLAFCRKGDVVVTESISRIARNTKDLLTMKEEYREEYRKFGLNVVYYRKKLRLTQLQLAELLDIQRSHISAIELGNVGVSFDLLFKMCEVFNIKPKDLFDFRD